MSDEESLTPDRGDDEDPSESEAQDKADGASATPGLGLSTFTQRFWRALLPLERWAKLQLDLHRVILPHERMRRLVRDAQRFAFPVEHMAKLQRDLQRLAFPVEQMAKLQRDLQRTVIDAAKQFHEHWTRAMPANWRGLSGTQVGALVELMGRTGLGLAWVPRQEIVVEILDAPNDQARFRILTVREPEVVADLQQALDDVAADQLSELKAAASEAHRAHVDGYHSPAQALAAAALTDLIENHLGSQLSKLRRDFERVDPMEVAGPLEDLRLLTLLVALAKSVLSRFDREGGSVPRTFNRHAALHTVSTDQYTPLNALCGLLLLVSLLRELEERN
jgi:hypothetical protein